MIDIDYLNDDQQTVALKLAFNALSQIISARSFNLLEMVRVHTMVAHALGITVTYDAPVPEPPEEGPPIRLQRRKIWPW